MTKLGEMTSKEILEKIRPLGSESYKRTLFNHGVKDYIDPLETGRWMDWLRETFPEDQLKRRFNQMLVHHRTADAAKQWLSEQPEEFVDRLLNPAH